MQAATVEQGLCWWPANRQLHAVICEKSSKGAIRTLRTWRGLVPPKQTSLVVSKAASSKACLAQRTPDLDCSQQLEEIEDPCYTLSCSDIERKEMDMSISYCTHPTQCVQHGCEQRGYMIERIIR